MPPNTRPPREIIARRAPKRVVRRRRGRGEGFDLAGNTTLDIEFRINGLLDKKITAVNVSRLGQNMRFRIRNTDQLFNHDVNQEYIRAFMRMLQGVENAGT